VRVGLTGGIASGKSTVSTILAGLGAVVVDSDRIAREVVARGTPGLAQVVEAFGPDVLTPDGDLDRPALGAIVFADPEQRKRLEAITHPLIGARSAELAAAAGPDQLVVHDIPLLVEGGMAPAFDEVLVVDVPPELQVERMLRDRGMTRADAEARIAAQATRAQRLAVATYVVENTGTLEELRERVVQVHQDLVGDARVRAAVVRVLSDLGTSEVRFRRREDLLEFFVGDGDGDAVFVGDLPGTEAELLVLVADRIQNDVHVWLPDGWGAALPPCPGHPHPMNAEVRDGAAWWTCPATREAVARVGRL
jgi:dephospho-CoA kinase